MQCKRCNFAHQEDSKFPQRLPPKEHPPRACGFTTFGSSSSLEDVAALARDHGASLVVLLRRNHVAQAISLHRFQNASLDLRAAAAAAAVPWAWPELADQADRMRQAYDKLLRFAEAAPRVHLIFYEDLKARPAEVWDGLQDFLRLPRRHLPRISQLEAKSSSRPSVEYLVRLEELRAKARGSSWEAMLADPNYDDHVDLTAEFRAVCARFPGRGISWRAGACPASG